MSLTPPRRRALSLVSWAAVTTGVVALRTRYRSRDSYPRLHLLEYHEIDGGPSEPEGTVSARRFRRHLRYLKKSFGLETVSRGFELLHSTDGPAQDIVAVTFDDGLAGNYRWAWPILQEEAHGRQKGAKIPEPARSEIAGLPAPAPSGPRDSQ